MENYNFCFYILIIINILLCKKEMLLYEESCQVDNLYFIDINFFM